MEFTAALLTDADRAFSLKKVSLGDIGPHEVLIRLVASGICHSDLTVRDGVFPVPRPIILGHEGSGFVERVGQSVSKVRVGDPVALTFMSCGVCLSCANSSPAYCSQFGPLNMSGLRADGTSALSLDSKPIGGHFFGQSSFAQYSVANERNVLKVRADAPLEMIGPFGCGIQTGAGAIINVLKPTAKQSLVVFGGGGVGLSAVMAAAVIGCSPIIVVEPKEDRRRVALSVGATKAIDPLLGSVSQNIIEATGGGADAILDTSGISEVIEQAINTLAARGSLGLVAMHGLDSRVSFSLMNVISKGATIRGIVEGDSNPDAFLPYLIDLFVEGRFPVDKMVKFYEFDQLNAAAADQASGATIKPIIRFDHSGCDATRRKP